MNVFTNGHIKTRFLPKEQSKHKTKVFQTKVTNFHSFKNPEKQTDEFQSKRDSKKIEKLRPKNKENYVFYPKIHLVKQHTETFILVLVDLMNWVKLSSST